MELYAERRTEHAERFHYHKVGQEEDFQAGSADYNHLVFILAGSMAVSCNEFAGRTLSGGEFILIPVGADTAYTVLSDSEALVFTFGQVAIDDADYLNTLAQLNEGKPYDFKALPVREPLSRFLHYFTVLIKDGKIDMELLSPLKAMELFILLKEIYTPQEVAALLHPLTGSDRTFRLEVLRSYRRAAGSINHMADTFGMEKRSFSRRFTEEFGTSPYQWMQEQRARHICFTLRETDLPLRQVHQMYGFRFPGHFTRFCREQFGTTPLRLRREMKLARNKN